MLFENEVKKLRKNVLEILALSFTEFLENCIYKKVCIKILYSFNNLYISNCYLIITNELI